MTGTIRAPQQENPEYLIHWLGTTNLGTMGTILPLTMGIEKSSGKIEVLEALCFKDFLAETVGVEPTCPFGQLDFESSSLRPLRYVSV